MAITASGSISLTDLMTEFSVSAPASLTDFYRGGGNVPDTPANSGIPTSGSISITDFYSASAASDATPAAVNWPDISGSYTTFETVNTISQTFTSIDVTITVEIARTSSTGTLSVYKNGGYVNVVPSGGSMTTTVVSGDYISFIWGIPSGSVASTVTVTNQSDGNATLDTFAINTTGT